MEEKGIDLKSLVNFFKDKRIQTILVILLFLLTLFVGAQIRTSGLENLVDSSTGDYTPLALDPYYFLRVSQTMIDGGLPEIDSFRSPHLGVSWTKELLPASTVILYKAIKIFSPDSTINFANVLNPVAFWVLGIIIFFALVWLLSKNRWIALSSSFILAIIPPYLYRTLAGFSDHESIGMFGFFLAMFFFSLGLIYLDKKKKSPKKSLLVGFIAGIMTMFAIASWGGGAKFLFMILPLAFLVRWLTKKEKDYLNNILFYSSWIFGVLIFGGILSFGMLNVLRTYMLNSTGILTFFALGYSLTDSILKNYKILPEKFSKYKELISFGMVVIFGLIVYQIVAGGAFGLIKQLLSAIINPFGTERVSLTVAENAQPYLNDLISQLGKSLFYTFIAGCLIVGFYLSKGIKENKISQDLDLSIKISAIVSLIGFAFSLITLGFLWGILLAIISFLVSLGILWIISYFSQKSSRYVFSFSFLFFIIGILFSRVSSEATLNGENLISQLFFIFTFLIFALSTVYICCKSKWEIETRWILIAAWMIPMLLAVRSAVRVFFAIVPFISFLVPLTIFELFKVSKKIKENIWKNILLLLGAVLILFMIITFFYGAKGLNENASNQSDKSLDSVDLFTEMGYLPLIKDQAKYQSPSYTSIWQETMGWVRNNTPVDALFLHWWDYGYWVQTGGERATFSDGGHSQSAFGDHLVARYVLTTPFPETAKSFMKTLGITHLLIDPTDLGKYSAYSSIGDDNDSSDRYSYLPTFLSYPAETQETREKITRTYRGGFLLDEDLVYEFEGEKIYFSKENSFIGGIFIEKNLDTTTNIENYSQPIGAFFANGGKQYNLPLRYLYVEGKLIDFGNGVESTAYVYTRVYATTQGTTLDSAGALVYLTKKTKDSLFSKLYLMKDPLGEYSELNLVREQGTLPINFYYDSNDANEGFKGPIRIWEVNTGEMTNIISHEEFKNTSGEYGELDDFDFGY